MTAKKSGVSPDKRRKYDEAFKAETLRLAGESRSTQAAARQLGISPKLLYRWQQARLVAEVGSEQVARDTEVRALRARLKRAEQELDILKKPWSSSASRPGEHLPAHCPSRWPGTRAPALPRAAGGARRVLRLAAPSAAAGGRTGLASGGARGIYASQPALRHAPAAGRNAGPGPRGGPLAHPARAQSPRLARPTASFVPRITDSDPTARAAPNRLLGQPAPTAPNRVWVGDITYLPQQGGG